MYSATTAQSPPVQSHHQRQQQPHHLTVPESNDELNQLSIKSLSELYLGSHSAAPRPSNPFLSTALLNNLRSRLNETAAPSAAHSPSFAAGSSSRRGSGNPSTKSGYHHHHGSGGSGKHGKSITPLETLFQPPGDFLSPNKGDSLDAENASSAAESVKAGVAESRKSSSGSSTSAPATRSQRLQAWLYAFLNQPSNPLAIFYHLILSLLFVIYIFLVIFTDRTTWHQYCSPDFLSAHNRDLVPTLKTVFERCLLLYFVLFEYVIRLYASRSRPYYVELPWWRYMARYHYRLAHLFDLVIVCAGVIASSCQVALPLDFTQDVHALIVLRGLHRLFNVAQWSSVKARHSPWALMAEVFQEQGSMLFGIFYLESLVVFFMAYFLFLAETHTREETDKVTIENMVDALYCSSITLLTIGYGDKTPVTLLGKTIVSAGIIIGLGLFGLPAGIIATSLAIKLNEQDQIRSRSERRQAAAVLIQRVWRFQRRLKRFTLASMIIESKHHYNNINNNGTAEGGGGGAGERARTATASSLNSNAFSNIKIDNKLYEKLDYLVSRKTEFLQMQFLDQIRIQQSRRQFTEMLKRHNAAPSNSSRHLIKQHWIEHRQLTELLETMHERLDKYAQQIPSYEQSFDLMEEKLIRLQTRMEAQRAMLERMNLRP